MAHVEEQRRREFNSKTLKLVFSAPLRLCARSESGKAKSPGLPSDFGVLRFPAREGHDPTGFEQPSEKPDFTVVSSKSGAKSGALDSDLQELINNWSQLSTADRSVVLAMVRALVQAKGGREGGL